MHPAMARPTTTQLLQAELDSVTGDRCGWTCQDHHVDTFPDTGCERATGHTGAQRLVDVHLAHDTAGELVTATECCPGGA